MLHSTNEVGKSVKSIQYIDRQLIQTYKTSRAIKERNAVYKIKTDPKDIKYIKGLTKIYSDI